MLASIFSRRILRHAGIPSILAALLILTTFGCDTNDLTAPETTESMQEDILAAPARTSLALAKAPLESFERPGGNRFGDVTPALNWHLLAESFQFWPSDLQFDLPLNVTLPLDPIEVDVSGNLDTSGMGGLDTVEYSVEGTFEFPSDLEIDSDDLNLSMVAGTGGIPYFVKLTLNLGDIAFESQGNLDITVCGIGLLVGVEGTLDDVVITIYLEPPHPNHNHISMYGDPELSFTPDIDFELSLEQHDAFVAGLAWLMPPFNLAPPPFNILAAEDFVTAVEADLEDAMEDLVEAGLAGLVETQVIPVIQSSGLANDAADALDAWFWLLAALRTNTVSSLADADTVVICSTQYTPMRQRATYYVMPGN